MPTTRQSSRLFASAPVRQSCTDWTPSIGGCEVVSTKLVGSTPRSSRPTTIGPPALEPLPRRSSTCDGSSLAFGSNVTPKRPQDADHERKALALYSTGGVETTGATDSVDQQRRRRILRDTGVDADLFGLSAHVAVEGVEDDADAASIASQRLRDHKSAEVAHVRIEDEDIGTGRVHQAQGILAVARDADHDHP